MADQQPQQQPPSFEYQRWIHELQRHDAERAHDRVNEFTLQQNKDVIDGGNLALRSLILINGGAAVSVLAFIGGLAAQGKITSAQKLEPIASSLAYFAIGVVAGVLAMALAYFTNYCIGLNASSLEQSYEHPFLRPTTKSKCWGAAAIVFHVLAVIVSFGSGGLFIYGVFQVKDAIIHVWQ